MFSELSLSRLINPLRGWRTDRKIVVLESDDWGSIRMPSRRVLEKLQPSFPSLQSCPYNQNDALECNEDLSALLDVLGSVTGKDGSSPILTFNNIVANPDFERIERDGFDLYHRESFVETLSRYPGRDLVLTLYRQGIDERLLRPQLHGAEHLNVARWMQALRSGDRKVRTAFRYGLLGLPFHPNADPSEFMESLAFETEEELDITKTCLTYALREFEKIWNFSSKTFIAPCYTWHGAHEKVLAEGAVKAMQGIVLQKSPRADRLGTRRRYHYLGQRNACNQIYLIRNAFFEPTISAQLDADHCLQRIDLAFRLRKPAIIGTHRLNFVGSIRSRNRDRNLQAFSGLLRGIVKKWPIVEFMSSDDLAMEIRR